MSSLFVHCHKIKLALKKFMPSLLLMHAQDLFYFFLSLEFQVRISRFKLKHSSFKKQFLSFE